MTELDFERRYFSGKELYGDDFTPEQISAWHEDERLGYFKLATDHYGIATANEFDYEYDALNRFHAFDWLAQFQFGECLALGCARGDDVAALAPNVSHFIGLEPAEEWWADNIAGKPATFMAPTVLGDIPLASASVDLAVSLGVLHHIPNVSKIITEVGRVLKPGGYFVIREPINSMGDWRRPRVGLTKNERGLPLSWVKRSLTASGYRILRSRLCMINAAALIFSRPGRPGVYNNRVYCALDWLASEALSWNVSYYRANILKKLAPSSVFIIAQR